MGQAIYRFKMNLLFITIIAVIALYILVPIGVAFPINLPENKLVLTH